MNYLAEAREHLVRVQTHCQNQRQEKQLIVGQKILDFELQHRKDERAKKQKENSQLKEQEEEKNKQKQAEEAKRLQNLVKPPGRPDR